MKTNHETRRSPWRWCLAAVFGAALGPGTAHAETTVTYHQNVRPIIDGYCTGCHQTGGIGPFPLTDYQQVSSKAGIVADATANGRMPPWPAFQDCADYEDDRSLPQDHVRTLLEWAKAGAPEGDPSRPGASLPVVGRTLPRQDVVLSMDQPYTPQLHPDDYRCFVLDWPTAAQRFITGFGVRPGNKGIVHHLIAYLAPPEVAAQAVALDAAEPGPGYTCFGDPQLDQAAWLGGWAPGTQDVAFPSGTGIEVRPGSKVVLQMHYHIHPHHGHIGGHAPADQSSLYFATAETVGKPAWVVPWADPGWLDDPATMGIPAGNPFVTHRMAGDLAAAMHSPVTIHGVFLHMHQLGKSATLTLAKNGADQCLLSIPDWDFDWQYMYWLKEPRKVQSGDQVTVTCNWDNSLGNQPFNLGRRLLPRDVGWGSGTRDEMCLGILYVTKDG